MDTSIVVALVLGVATLMVAIIGLMIKIVELGRRQAGEGLAAGTASPETV